MLPQNAHLSEPSGLTLGFEQAKDIVLTDCGGCTLAFVILYSYSEPSFVRWRGRLRESNRTWALHVSDDRSGLVVHELDADLGDTTARTYPSSQKIRFSFHRFDPSDILFHRYQVSGKDAPVRPRTRVTLTSLTGCLEASIVAT